jgi:hypothetical protein
MSSKYAFDRKSLVNMRLKELISNYLVVEVTSD